jgi:hypothetical protein
LQGPKRRSGLWTIRHELGGRVHEIPQGHKQRLAEGNFNLVSLTDASDEVHRPDVIETRETALWMSEWICVDRQVECSPPPVLCPLRNGLAINDATVDCEV